MAADLLPGGPVNGAVVVDELKLHLAVTYSWKETTVGSALVSNWIFEVHVRVAGSNLQQSEDPSGMLDCCMIGENGGGLLQGRCART